MDPEKTSNPFPLELSQETRRRLLASALGELEQQPIERRSARRPGRWGREHTILLAASACGVATSTIYVVFMLTGISPLDPGEAADDGQLPQFARELLAVAELAFLALVGSWATWTVIRRS